MPCRSAAIAALALLAAAAGCSQTTSVSGTVTYEGQPVEKGSIAFLPADGKGPSFGGEIVAGKYRVEGIAPGRKRVEIAGGKAVRFAKSTEELARQAQEAARGAKPQQAGPDDVVSPKAVGNQVEVEVKSGAQTLDFPLKKP